MVWFRLCHLVNIKLWTNINFFSILGVLLGSPYRNKIGKIILQNVQVVFFSHYCTYSHLHYSYALCNLLVRYLIVRYKLASPPDLSCNTFYLVDDLCLNFIGLLVLFWLWKRSCWRILEKWKERERWNIGRWFESCFWMKNRRTLEWCIQWPFCFEGARQKSVQRVSKLLNVTKIAEIVGFSRNRWPGLKTFGKRNF